MKECKQHISNGSYRPPRVRTKRRGYHQNGYKLDGETKSLDMCPHCKAFYCDPMSMSREYSAKQDRRHRAGVCTSCDSNPCKCKSIMKKRW